MSISRAGSRHDNKTKRSNPRLRVLFSLPVPQKFKRAVKAIAVSRHSRFFDLSKYSRYGFFHVAQKPYDIGRLHELLQQAMLS